ncbi:hypothetical protein [Streptomyces sp. NRRL S-495]|uniref:hypothetical protein n=1 Tax=Streptomyces sp. NRRL S-495 TaxID=1609133 RepID=UPI000A8BE679|nr:hypothetical protein [Streptomyces sp. NRRL S-495]
MRILLCGPKIPTYPRPARRQSGGAGAIAGSTDRPQDGATRSVEARLRAALELGDLAELRALYERLGRPRVALTEAGFHWIDERTGGVRVTGLEVRYFDEWTDLCIDLLLFQRQD